MLIHVCVLVRRLRNESCHISDSIASNLADMSHVTHLIHMLIHAYLVRRLCNVCLCADSAMSHVTHLTLLQNMRTQTHIYEGATN